MEVYRRAWSVLVLALPALVLATGCRETGAPVNLAESVQPGPVISGLAEDCPDPATPVPYPAGGRLPEGAVGVRMCNGVEDLGAESQFDVDAPADELTTDVPDLIELVNTSQPADTSGFCAADAGPDLVFWFRYADGSAHAVRYERYGCRRLLVGEGLEHTRGEDLHVAFDERLAAQRSVLRPPRAVPEPSCDLDAPVAAGDRSTGLDLGVGAAAVCLARREGGLRLVAALNRRQLDLVSSDFHLRPGTAPGSCTARQPFMLVGSTAWGDRFLMSTDGCTFVLSSLRRTSDLLLWRASPQVIAMFQRLIAGR